MKTALLLPALFLAAACGQDFVPSGAAGTSAEVVKKKTSNVRKTPVPYGTELACSALLDEEQLSEQLGSPVAVTAGANKPGDATSSCSIRTKQVAAKNTEAVASELCLVNVYCSYVYDESNVELECAKDGLFVQS